jgi:hypothetical protein
MENGHASPIDGLTFTPNGQALLSLSVRDGTMRLWDIETGQHLRCFEFDLADVSNHASFSADGREIVTTGGESLLIWDTATSMVDRRFDPLGILDVSYDSAVFSQQGKRLITSTREQRAAYVWDGERGDLLALLRHTGFVEEAVDSPDGATILTIVTDPDNFNQREAWLWDAGHAALEQAAVAQSLVLAGLQAGWDGDVPGMVIALREAEAFSPDDGALLHPAVWDRACRFGSLAGQPEEVVDACQRAVELAEQQATGTLGAATVAPFRDSRGLALALLGAYPEAIADFQYYVDNPTFLEDEDVDRRLAWIAALRDNRNPFDEATLQALRTEME